MEQNPVEFPDDQHSDSSKNTMKNYLDKQIGDRYAYNFYSCCAAFTNVLIGGNLDIGEQVPDNA